MAAEKKTSAAASLCLSLLFLLPLLCCASGTHGGAGAGCKPHLPRPKHPGTPTRRPAPPPTKKYPPKQPPANPFCPRDALKLGACAELLGLAGVAVGAPPSGPGGECCEVLGGLAAAEAAACLCTVVKGSLLGIVTGWSVAVSALVSACKTEVPDGFRCV